MIQNAKKRILSLSGKVLLGLSGGPDSMCLYHLLRECNKDFVVAHLDHGLRSISTQEEKELSCLAKKDGVSFYSKRLTVPFSTNNLEERLREERMAFFKEVMEKEKIDVLFLGHQKDERAETILKRFFEGGSIFHLPAMQEEVAYEGIFIVRPLIETTKKQVLKYLEQKGSVYFVDPTNIGKGNLRARMRSMMIPELEKAFGKNITSSVCANADQLVEIKNFIERSLAPLEGREIEGPFGIFFPKFEGVDSYLFVEWVIRSLKTRIELSRDQRLLLQAGKCGKHLSFEGYDLYTEEVGIFLLDKAGRRLYGTVEKEVSWQEFWEKGEALLGFCEISKEVFSSLIDKKKWSEWHRKQKTPLCLRSFFPIPLTSIRKNIKIGVST